MTTFSTRYAVFDRFQQRHRWLGFPLAVLQKYADDQGGYLAASITYYGFFAVFPLLLVLTTVLGFVLQSHPHLEQAIIDSALGQFPVIGPQLKGGTLHGSTLGLGLGLAAALWAGMGAVMAAQNAMNHMWGVPFKRRPDPLKARVRALLLLGLLGGGVIATTVLAGLATVGAELGAGWQVGSVVLSTALNIGLFWIRRLGLNGAPHIWFIAFWAAMTAPIPTTRRRGRGQAECASVERASPPSTEAQSPGTATVR